LQYLHENGCPWDVRSYFSASRSKKYECLKYIEENGGPKDDSD